MFGPLFFPTTDDPLLGAYLAFSGFAIGFIARPLGRIAFGHEIGSVISGGISPIQAVAFLIKWDNYVPVALMLLAFALLALAALFSIRQPTTARPHRQPAL